MRRHDILVLNGIKVGLGYDLVCCDDKISIISVNKVSQDFGLDVL